MPDGKERPEELLHREPRIRAPRRDLQQHRLKQDDPDLETDAMANTKKTATLTLDGKNQILAKLDEVAAALEKSGDKASALSVDQVQNELDGLFDAPEKPIPDQPAPAVAASTKMVGDLITIQITSSVRLAGDPDQHGFRTPTFVREANLETWKAAVAKLVEEGKSRKADGTPDYGAAIDYMKAMA